MSEAAKPKTNFDNAWQEARALVHQHRGRLLVGLGLMVVNRAAGFVLPLSPKYVFDEAIAKHKPEVLPMVALALGVATLVQAVSSFGLSQLLGVAAQRAIADMRKRVMVQISRLPVRFFDSTQSGVLISRVMADAEGVRNLVGTGLVLLVSSTITAIVALFWLFALDWKLTLINIAFLLVFGGVMAYAFGTLRPLFRERGKIQAEVSGRLGETLGGIRIVKGYTAERREQLVFAKGAHRLFRNVAQTMTGVSGVTALSGVVAGVISIIMIMVGGPAIMSGHMTLGEFGTYVVLTGMLAEPVMQLTAIGTQITDALAGLDRIREIMDTRTEDAEDESRASAGVVRGEVQFENVWFEYRENLPVLKDINFTAKAGTTTALVGSSGSGKSTLIGLVLAFHRPKSGRILLDGRDLETLKLRDYRHALGVVLQDNFLFDGTIADNIAFSRPGSTREEVIAVSKVAHCHEFVSDFPDGYDTVVGERGVKLSGGQRQRVAIARAILAKPKILILDEATSSLDSESEAQIQDGLNTLRRGRTSFVIAHRLSTIRDADQILVLENGAVVERGTHEELLERNGRYRQLYDRQYKIELNRFINPGEDFTPEPARVESSARPTSL